MEAVELQLGIALVGRVGVGEVGEDALDFEVITGQRGFEKGFGTVVMDADALHAGVDLEMDFGAHPHRPCRLLDLPQLLDR